MAITAAPTTRAVGSTWSPGSGSATQPRRSETDRTAPQRRHGAGRAGRRPRSRRGPRGKRRGHSAASRSPGAHRPRRAIHDWLSTRPAPRRGGRRGRSRWRRPPAQQPAAASRRSPAARPTPGPTRRPVRPYPVPPRCPGPRWRSVSSARSVPGSASTNAPSKFQFPRSTIAASGAVARIEPDSFRSLNGTTSS